MTHKKPTERVGETTCSECGFSSIPAATAGKRSNESQTSGLSVAAGSEERKPLESAARERCICETADASPNGRDGVQQVNLEKGKPVYPEASA